MAIAETVIASGLLLMAILVVYQVLGRNFFAGTDFVGSTLDWVEELARYLAAWVTLVFVAFGVARGSHISANVLPKRLVRYRPAAVALAVIHWGTFGAIGAIWFYYGFGLVTAELESGARSITSLHAPYWLVHLCIPVAGVIVIVAVVLRLRMSRDISASEPPKAGVVSDQVPRGL